MCGYCTEDIALEILGNEVRGNLRMEDLSEGIHQYYFLRESPDFISALDRLRRSLAVKRIPFYSMVPHAVVLYRGLEVLLKQGFESPAYQRLLKISLYRDAVSVLCDAEQRQAFESATEGLNSGYMGMLYDAETYFMGKKVKPLKLLSNALPACRDILKHYISWWLDGEGLDMATEYGVTDEEQARFDLLLRAFYFSTLVIGSSSAGKKMMSVIAERHPVRVPLTEGDDLWLQRVAAQNLYQIESFDAFLKHLMTFRYGHYYYVDQVCVLSHEQKQALQAEVHTLLAAERTLDLVRMSEWLGQ